MARKKHHSKKTHHVKHRRKKIGAIGADQKTLLTQTLGGIVGAVAGTYVGKVIENSLNKSDSMAKYSKYANGASQLAIGYFMPKLVKQSSPMLKGVQMGLMISGGLNLVKATNILPGIGAMPGSLLDYRVPMVAGVSNTRNAMPLNVRSAYKPPYVGAVRNKYYGAMHAATGM